VKLDLRLDLSGNSLLGKDVCEITRELIWVDLLDLTTRKFNQAGKALDIRISSCNSH